MDQGQIAYMAVMMAAAVAMGISLWLIFRK